MILKMLLEEKRLCMRLPGKVDGSSVNLQVHRVSICALFVMEAIDRLPITVLH